jgi:hypothetical protein
MATLYLHIGAGKTGTSFLQGQLALQHNRLASNGVYYPTWNKLLQRVERGEVTTGNIGFIMPWLLPKHPSVIRQNKTDEDSIKNSRKWFKTSIRQADGRNIVFSGEAMQHAETPAIKQLIKLASEENYDTQVIYYVRHALDHALSDYREHVQRGFRDGYERKELKSVEGWLTSQLVPFGRTIKNYSQALPDTKINVRSYDAERKDLWRQFLKHINTVQFDSIDPGGTKIINRSLTVLETQFLEAASAVLDQARMRELGMQLISAPPHKVRGVEPQGFMVSEETLENFRKEHKPMVDEINDRWSSTLETPLCVVPPDYAPSTTTARPLQLLDLSFHLLSK